MTEMLPESERVPDAEEVSVDYLYKPRPPSHEFHFRTGAMLGVVTIVALLLGLLRWLFA